MANPYTNFLRRMQGNREAALATFVAWWDGVEAIVVDVNKRRSATDEERAAYAEARAALLADYDSVWAARFAPHWPLTKEAGAMTPSDPFPRILAAATADDFVRNRRAMQALAAARETINRYVLAAR